MNDYATHARAVAALQARLGADCPSITWGQETIDVIPGSAERRSDLGPGGFTQNAFFNCEVLVSSFEGYSNATDLKNDIENEQIGYLGDLYKVDAVNVRPGHLQVQLVCSAVTQNA